MDISSIGTSHAFANHEIARANEAVATLQGEADVDRERELFDQFAGETFYGILLKSMRATTSEPAYFHGGRAERMWQSQLDQQLVENLATETADTFTGPMFDLYSLGRR